LNFFLRYCLQGPADDPFGRGWYWQGLDREGTHQGLVQMFLKESPEFAKVFLGTDRQVIKCIRRTERDTFDLGVTPDNREERQIEIKIDQPWNQANKQVNYLRNSPHTKGLILTLSQSAFRRAAGVAGSDHRKA